MAKNDLLTLGILGVGAYAVYKLMSANQSGENGGGYSGGIYDVSTPAGAPLAPATPTPPDSQQVTRLSAPVISAETQAAIDAGQLNIFGVPNRTTPYGAQDTPFMKDYNAKVAEAVRVTGDPNISSTRNLLASVLPLTYGVDSARIQSALTSIPKKSTVSQDVANRLDPGLASALGLSQTVSKASSSSGGSKSTTSPAAQTVAKSTYGSTPAGYTKVDTGKYAYIGGKKETIYKLVKK